MEGENNWESFFDKIAPDYMNACFTKYTSSEVDFMEAEFGLTCGDKIIDIGCGTGRHSLELARRGYKVTGLDLSSKMLEEAKKVSEAEILEIEFIRADAADFSLENSFDGAISICEGAFGLLSVNDDTFKRDQKILENICHVLKPGAKLILTALNGLKKIRESTEEDVEQGRFDPVNIVESIYLSELLEEDLEEDIILKEKGFLAPELKLMHEKAGFKVAEIYGGTAGEWNRERLKLDEMEIMIISRKNSGR